MTLSARGSFHGEGRKGGEGMKGREGKYGSQDLLGGGGRVVAGVGSLIGRRS